MLTAASVLTLFVIILWSSSSLIFQHGSIALLDFHVPRRVIVAADSRQTSAADKTRHWDDACKIISLTNQTLFVATGTVRAVNDTGEIFFDANESARAAFKLFLEQPNDASRLNKVADKFADLMQARLISTSSFPHEPFNPDPEDGSILRGIFIGTNPAGELFSFQAKISLTKQAPPIFRTDVLAVDTREIEALSPKAELVEFLQKKTQRSIEANAALDRAASGLDQDHADAMRLAFAIDYVGLWHDNHLTAGGDVDQALLRSGGSVTWLRRKQNCYAEDYAPTHN